MSRKQTSDRDAFLHDVVELLREKGYEPQLERARPDEPNPYLKAGQLLSALGITPVVDQLEALRLSDQNPWSDREE